MKFLLSVDSSSEDRSGEEPQYLRVEINEADVERLKKVQVALSMAVEVDFGALFSEVKVDWLGPEWFQNPPRGYGECVILTDDPIDSDLSEEELSGEEVGFVRGSECFIDLRRIRFEAYNKHCSETYSAWSISIKSVLEAFEMTVKDAVEHINNNDPYMRTRARELLGNL